MSITKTKCGLNALFACSVVGFRLAASNKRNNYTRPASVLDKIFIHELAIRTLTNTTAFILGHLAFNITRHGRSTDSKGTIAKRIGCERKTVQLCIQRLVSLEWIEQRPDTTPSGISFIFGAKLPISIKTAYEALNHRYGKSRDSGFLIEVELKVYPDLPKSEIRGKKAAKWRIIAYLRGLIAYRNASHGRRCQLDARAKYFNKTALANALGVCLKTLSKYLKLLKESSEIKIVRERDGLYLDATGPLLDLAKYFYKRLERKTFLNT